MRLCCGTFATFRTFIAMLGAFLATGYAALFLYIIRRAPFFSLPGIGRSTAMALFLLKIAFAVGLWYIYTYHYTDRSTADIYKYFDPSAVMFGALREHPMDYVQMLFGIRNDTPYFTENYYVHMDHWYRKYESNLYNDSHTMIRFNALVRIFSFGHFHVHSVFAAFLSFTGLSAIHKAFAPSLAGRERALGAAVFLIPSVLFWASGVIKESLLFFGLGVMLWQLFRWMNGRITAGGITALLFCTVLLFFLKFYVLLSMFPALVALAFCRRWPRRPLLTYAIVVCGLIGIGLNVHHVIRGFEILEILWWKQKDFIGLATMMHSGSFVQPPVLEPTFWSFVKSGPYALYSSLAGPMFHPGGGGLGLVSAAENGALLLVAAVLFWHRRAWAQVDKPLFYFCITYVVLLALVIGYTTPVMGAVVRYRTPLLPFLLIAALLVADERKLVARWPWMRSLFA